MTINIKKVEPPALPIAVPAYERAYQDQLNNVHRLFYNRLTAALSALIDQIAGGGALITFPYGAFHQDGVTTLTANISNNSTTPIPVVSTADFPAAGWFLIGTEIIAYTAKTPTTFTGITRGALGTTNVAHNTGAAVSEVQGTGSPTTIGSVLFNSTDYSNGVYVLPSDLSRVYFNYAGIYNIQISAQLLNYTTSDDNVTLWFARNGLDIPYSASVEQVNSKHGGNPGASLLTVNIFQEFAVGDYLQIRWASGTGNTVVGTYPASTSPVHPVSPAIILTTTFVSAV